MALTGIAGVRYAISPHLDAGVKYQYLHTGKLNFADASALNGTGFTTTATGHYNSSNVLASLVYNFNSRQAARLRAAEPVEAAPPPASAPATQTCPDGSVALATSPCPAPPPPPPPPPPAERGERGR